MPNWCNNTATFKHSDTDQIRKLIQAYNDGKLFSTFVPCPEELLNTTSPVSDTDLAAANTEKYGAPDWYNWCLENWGTKWDVGNENIDKDEYTPGQTEVTLHFDSAWSPPLAWYNTMADQFGFEIEAYYLEVGMAFCGKWTNEDWDAEAYEFADADAEWIEENIPSDIIEHWDLLSLVEMYEDED